ncbi:MAG: hypothetical protein WB789_01810, partial [Thermoplasmata archaeon]
STPTAVPAPRTPPSAGGSDDMLLFGLLAMGAGAGLVAALAKRIQDGPLTPAAPPPRSKPVSSSR